MSQFIVDNKEILWFCVSVIAVLLSLVLGPIRSWRHDILHGREYRSDRDVAVNILGGKYIQRTCNQFLDIANEQKRQKTSVAEIYKRPEQQQIIRELSKDLSDQNQVKHLFGRLVLASEASFGCLWVAIIVVVIGFAIVWISPPISVWVIWAILLGALVAGFLVSVTIMWVFDVRFSKLVHSIIQREGE